MTKQVVHYKPIDVPAGTGFEPIVVGGRAVVIPVDHPDTVLVYNGHPATTSEVLSYDRNTGEFETLNSRYVLAN